MISIIMLPMKRILILLFILSTSAAISQNIMSLGGAFARPGDTISISVNIHNTSKFISFQFDLQLPPEVSFQGYSLKLSSRSTNHVAIGNLVEMNRLRIFAYSPNNDPFTGNNGDVIAFKLAVGNIRGEFPLLLESAIIGDSLSRNVLSGVENGILSVFPLNITGSNLNIGRFDFKINPNPLSHNSFIQFKIPFTANVEFRVYNQLGEQVFIKNLGVFQTGQYSTPLPQELIAKLQTGALFHFILIARQHEKIRATSSCKVIKM